MAQAKHRATSAARFQVEMFMLDKVERGISFLTGEGHINPGAVVRAQAMYDAYRVWYAANVERLNWDAELTMTAFGRAAGLFMRRYDTNRGREYRGVRLRD